MKVLFLLAAVFGVIISAWEPEKPWTGARYEFEDGEGENVKFSFTF
jgi:hypothetical protein